MHSTNKEAFAMTNSILLPGVPLNTVAVFRSVDAGARATNREFP
jgi:hypothetical protein